MSESVVFLVALIVLATVCTVVITIVMGHFSVKSTKKLINKHKLKIGDEK